MDKPPKSRFKMLTTYDIRYQLAAELARENFVIDKSGCKMVEIIGASFIANEDTLFSKPDADYIRTELQWYNSMSLDIHAMGVPPKEWVKTADIDGIINSNYGWAIYSIENHEQFMHVVNELGDHRDSRRAIMIYTRPNMWEDYNKNGRSDFMCTNTVQYLIRDDQVWSIVNMRSNDAVYGYKNDIAWQYHVLEQLCDVLNTRLDISSVTAGPIIWNAGSLHVYERHFPLLKCFLNTNNFQPSKEELEKFK